MKCIVLGLITIALVGCSETRTVKKDSEYDIPEQLKDCEVLNMQSRTATDITVVRCPNSTTATGYTETRGKSHITRNTVVIDGVTYVQEKPSDVKDENQNSR